MKPFLDLSQVGIPIPTKDKHEIRFNCIFCEDEGYHLYVNTKKRIFHCFRCNASGRTNILNDTLEHIHLDNIGKLESSTPIGKLKLPPKHKDTLTKAAIRYLEGRGLYESDIENHKIYCAAAGSIYFGRVIIPCNPSSGWADYFVARSYTRLSFPKYVNPSGSGRHLFLSRNHNSKWRDLWGPQELLLVEGPFDFLKASRHGPTACLLGKNLSNTQAREIVTEFSKVYIMLDQGPRELVAAMMLANRLRPHVDVHVLQCPKKDPGEMIPSDFEEVFSG